MTTDQLEDEVRKTAWREVRVKRGVTNGQDVLHVRDIPGKTSRTIKGLGEWVNHPLHPRNRPKKARRKEDDGG
jgi:hypothetical protein